METPDIEKHSGMQPMDPEEGTDTDTDLTRPIKPLEEEHGKGTPQPARAVAVFLNGPELGREVSLDRQETVLGRALDSAAPLDSSLVSRRHAKITRTQTGGETRYAIADLGSTNGTWVNGERIDNAPLHNGDKVQLGDVALKFMLQDPLEARFHQELRRRIDHDELTGLLTVGVFLRELRDMVQRLPADEDTVFTLAMTDLDGLKQVNDTYGHLAGRYTIEKMGELMRQHLRPGDLAALYGGDEAILLFPATRLEEAARIAEALREDVAGFGFEWQGHAFRVTISQGLAEWPRHGEEPEDLVAAADRALYHAKAEGRNRVCTGAAAE